MLTDSELQFVGKMTADMWQIVRRETCGLHTEYVQAVRTFEESNRICKGSKYKLDRVQKSIGPTGVRNVERGDKN